MYNLNNFKHDALVWNLSSGGKQFVSVGGAERSGWAESDAQKVHLLLGDTGWWWSPRTWCTLARSFLRERRTRLSKRETPQTRRGATAARPSRSWRSRRMCRLWDEPALYESACCDRRYPLEYQIVFKEYLQFNFL